MRTKRLMKSTIAALWIVLTPLSTAHGAATLAENGQIQAPPNDIREVAADNAALVAEIEAVSRALKEERENTDGLIKTINGYEAAAEAAREAAEERRRALENIAEAERRHAEAERRRGRAGLLLGLVIGGIIGAAAAR